MAYKRHEMKVILFEQGDAVFADGEVTNVSDNDATTEDFITDGDKASTTFEFDS
ncbi:MAG: hypothetical protein LUG52_10575 [Clostridia bacterium]|nr:hypothetical protein [Clostridia bacterium]